MEKIKVEHLTFTYPSSKKSVLQDISFQIDEGDFVLLIGKSGSGKTTLLKNLKNEIRPHGEMKGNIYLDGKDLTKVDSSFSIGYVMQNTDNQIVCDKVWHELAFGLENMQMSQKKMQSKIAEVCYYFNIQDLFYQDTHNLSGGQKQLLNIASVMLTNPDVLILDEPFSKLDISAKEELLKYLKKMNEELGTTIIISEHDLKDLLPFCSKMIWLEEGKLIAEGDPKNVIKQMLKEDKNQAMMSNALKLSALVSSTEPFFTVKDARRYLKQYSQNMAPEEPLKREETAPVLTLKNVTFRYEKSGKEVLKELNLTIHQGEIYSIVSGNGSGKTTLLKVICKILKPFSGKINSNCKITMLPQEPKMLFSKNTVKEELESVTKDTSCMEKLIHELELNSTLENHPFDLSGGEEERVALAKVILCKGDILLLDEPTKGIDGALKEKLSSLLMELKKEGKTVMIVSHDMEFCAEVSDRCGMLFQGEIVGEDTAKEFFLNNSFYTNDIVRMTQQYLPGIVTWHELSLKIKEERHEKSNLPHH